MGFLLVRVMKVYIKNQEAVLQRLKDQALEKYKKPALYVELSPSRF